MVNNIFKPWIKVITPTNIKIKNVSGAFSSQSVKEAEINLGAVTGDRELFVELESSKGFKGIEEEEIPIQLQVEYQDKDGRKKLRVVNDRVKITKNVDEFKSAYDQKLNVMMNIQSAGQQYYAGKAKESKSHLKGLRSEMLEEMTRLKKVMPSFSEEEFSEGLEYLDDELDEMEMEEEKIQKAPAASYMASVGQSRTRLSEDKLVERMKRKKKK